MEILCVVHIMYCTEFHERAFFMYTYHSRSRRILEFLSRTRPAATAQICGMTDYSSVCGTLMLFDSHAGVFAVVSVGGIPPEIGCGNILGMHIHDPETGNHFDMGENPHPQHSGDLPPLFVEKTEAWAAFLTERIRVCDVIGKQIVIHSRRDDFTTQPSDDAGEKIACGIIKPN